MESLPFSLDERKAAVITALSAPALQEFDHYQYLLKLQQDLDTALQVARKENTSTARLIQFADFHLHIPEDQSFISCLLDELGAYATLPRQIGPVAVDSENLAGIVGQLKEVTILDDPDWRVPDAAIKQVYASGKTCRMILPYGMDQIILQTRIPGVRLLAEYNDSGTHDLVMDETGQASLSEDRSYFNTFRPMLLFDITPAEAATIEIPPEPVDRRIPWSELHKRSTLNPNKPAQSLAKKKLGQALISGDDNALLAAELGALWTPTALPAETILVTPSTLQQNPALEESDRLAAITEALRVSMQHLYASPKPDQTIFFPATANSLLIMTEVLGMTAEEVMRDEEALTDLAAYLTLLTLISPQPDNPNAELLALIRQTWQLPETPLGSNKMYGRVDWSRSDNKRQSAN